ncbi:MAG: hypothetical protein ACOY32_01230 [Thermodesulfobacteriota bacterium]
MATFHSFFRFLPRGSSLAAVIAVLSLLFVFPASGVAAEAPSFTLKVTDSRIDLVANEAPLGEILTAISREFRLTLRAAELPGELTSCRLASVPLEQGLEKLLESWNYALLYKKEGQGRALPDILWVMNRNPNRVVVERRGEPGSQGGAREQLLPQEEGGKSYRKEDIAAVFADGDTVLLDIDVRPADGSEFGEAASQPMPEEEERPLGIKITRLAETSPINMIGLREGDVVRDVNGAAVGSAADLVRSLAGAATGGVTTLRIERWRDGQMAPLYLEMR